jgi:hypothetical protein
MMAISSCATSPVGGECCCNCNYQQPIVAHPWNKYEFTRGPITERLGYGCVAPDLFPSITFFDSKHGMCECWSERDYSKYPMEYTMEILKGGIC